MGPCSRMKRLTMPRAGRPVMYVGDGRLRRFGDRPARSRCRSEIPGHSEQRTGRRRPSPACAGPQGKRGGDCLTVGNAACRDHWNFHGGRDSPHQREGANLGGDVGLEEHAAMAAGLRALRDDDVDAVLGEKASFTQCRGGAEDLASCCSHALEKERPAAQNESSRSRGEAPQSAAQSSSPKGACPAESGRVGGSTSSSVK